MPATRNHRATTQPETTDEVPAFVPHPWLRGGHRQTVVARFWSWPRPKIDSTYAEVDVSDGDRVSVLESVPSGWRAGDPVAILVHGLGGCARSAYITRVAQRLIRQCQTRVVRMNLRGSGSGFGRARSYYHSGKTADLRQVAGWLAGRAPGSPISLVGFSLGANLVLKLAGEAATDPVEQLSGVVAANPPVDLEACCRAIQQPTNRIYDQNFVRLLRAEVARLHARFPELGPIDLSPARSLLAFDELYTAPQNGFLDAHDYYQRSSARAWIGQIQVPGLIIHALDDPFIPADTVTSLALPPGVICELVPHGGHLGYLSRHPWGGDRRWLDSRIARWFTDQRESCLNNPI